jgi:hypothetical protein
MEGKEPKSERCGVGAKLLRNPISTYRASSHFLLSSAQISSVHAQNISSKNKALSHFLHYMKGLEFACLSTHLFASKPSPNYRAFSHKTTVLSPTIYIAKSAPPNPLRGTQEALEPFSRAGTLSHSSKESPLNSKRAKAQFSDRTTVKPPTFVPCFQSLSSRDVAHTHTELSPTKKSSLTVRPPTNGALKSLNLRFISKGKGELKDDLKKSSERDDSLFKKKGRGL